MRRADGGDDYEFTVTVVVPPELEPGEARISARWTDGGTFVDLDPVVLVTDAAPSGEAPPVPAGFGDTARPDDGGSDDSGPPVWMVAAAGPAVLALAAVALTVPLRRGTDR